MQEANSDSLDINHEAEILTELDPFEIQEIFQNIRSSLRIESE